MANIYGPGDGFFLYNYVPGPAIPEKYLTVTPYAMAFSDGSISAMYLFSIPMTVHVEAGVATMTNNADCLATMLFLNMNEMIWEPVLEAKPLPAGELSVPLSTMAWWGYDIFDDTGALYSSAQEAVDLAGYQLVYWDGDTTDLPEYDDLYRVAPNTPALDQLVDGYVVGWTVTSNGAVTGGQIPLDAAGVTDIPDAGAISILNATVTVAYDTTFFEDTGIWFTKSDTELVILLAYNEDSEPAVTYNVSVLSAGHGTASASATTVAEGRTVTLTVVPDEGYQFKEWHVTPSTVTISDNRFKMPAEDVTIVAYFEEIPPEPHGITVTEVEHGSATASLTEAIVGTVVNLVATPDEGYAFKSWQITPDTVKVTENSFVMPDEPVTVTAVFEAIQYSITVTSNEFGTASASASSATIGTVVVLTAKANTGYKFSGWAVSPATIEVVDNKFTMPASNVVIQAAFEEKLTGHEVTADCSAATQQIVDNLLAQLDGYRYQPYVSNKAWVDPAYELGDVVYINGLWSYLISVSSKISTGMICSVSAPYEQEVDHKFPYVGTVSRNLKRKVALGQSYYGTTISRERGLVIQKTDGENTLGEAVFNSDVLAMRAVVDGAMKDCIYFDTVEGKYKISGDVLIEGAVQSDANITDSLYAEQGDISQLTVDRLETSDKIQRYLNGDVTQLQFIRVEGLALQFIVATVSRTNDTPDEEHLQNRYGSYLYWKKDISDAEIVNGYPYVDGERVYVTEENTGFPVMVYSYSEAVVRQIMFIYDPDTLAYYCTETFGQGSGTNPDGTIPNQGFMQKTTQMFTIQYRTTGNKLIGITMNNSGYTDLYGLRKTSKLDFSKLSNNVFYEVIDGDSNNYEYTVTRDSQGRIVSITDSDGHTETITWEE